MATLHTLNKPSSHKELCEQLKLTLSEEDAILLLEDGVYHLLSINTSNEHHWLSDAKTVYALREDALSRGVSTSIEIPVVFVSYEQFVELTTTHSKVISWY